ncbi:hypothetical protein SEA_LTON_42 [Gordonia phage Lton]|uniref:Uncharacterized protein n=1 Tax=Gordonia phage Lucky10 TaxID=1821557 RepID=A0A142KB03_9CAUD|nr:hypothetical protein BJD62_gp43 [Gordonia phage Lucky10]AMS03286.1 hypothetical protein SEA_LUCKY10_43 [Gordonia phage Lucky10]UXE05016.1 hypothetical protein SEA_LTON_42 [Gordonia phage Lton]
MSHVLLDDALVPVETEHGDIHLTTASSAAGPRIVIATAGPECTDVHLTIGQAYALILQLLALISRAARRRGVAA